MIFQLFTMRRSVFIISISLILIICNVETIAENDWNVNDSTAKLESMKNFSISRRLVEDILEHFKNPASINLPLPIPDPFLMPDRMYPVVGVKVYTTEVTAHGISRVKIANFSSNIVDMEIHFGLRLPKLELLGNYSYHDWLTKHYYGGFNVTIVNGYVDCDAKLEITLDGELAAAQIKMDLGSHDDIFINIENAGLVGLFVNTLGSLLFDGIKPYFFTLIGNNIRGTLDDGLKKINIMFPNSIAPIDLGVARLRKFIIEKGFDPHYVADYEYASSVYSVDVTNIVVTGMSSVHRTADVKLHMENDVVNAVVNAATEILDGSCKWQAGIAGILTKSGSASFIVEYLNIMISVNQSLDIRKKPKVVDLKVTLGNIQLRMDGAGTLDYLAEAAVNILPNVLRYQILQAAETPMRRKVQEALDNTDVEQFVSDHLHLMEDQLYHHNVTKIEDNFLDEQLRAHANTFDEETRL